MGFEERQLLLDLFEKKNMKALRDELITFNEADIADFLEEMGPIERLAIFRVLPKDIAAEVFAFLEFEAQESLLGDMTNVELTEIVDKLYIDDMVDMLEELPATIVKKVMKGVHPERRNIINQYLQYPEDSAGSIMTAEFIDVKKSMTVGQALERIRTRANSETIYTLYITDAQRKLLGFLSARSILLNKDDVVIEDLMEEDVIFVHTSDDQEEVAAIFDKYDFLVLPVVDNEQRLVGVVTVDDVIDVIKEETTEDIERMAAIAPSDKPYLKSSVFELAKNRFVWLIVLLLTATVTGAIINKFEDALTAVTGVIAFLPMLTGAGGNAGSQASTMVIRGLSLDEIEIQDYYKVFLKELGVSLLVGIGLSVVNFFRIYIMEGNPKIAATVSLSLIFTIVIAKSAGGLLPIAAKKLNLDPTVMAAPLIATIVDTLSLLIYVFFVSLILI